MSKYIKVDDVMAFINTSNRGNCDYLIVDQIEELCNSNKVYDVEKVIAELEKKSHREESREFDHFFNKHLTFETDEVVYLDEAIEIIEAGGVE